MTQAQAIKQLAETRELYTDMLEPLCITFEQFLRLAQLPKDRFDAVIDKMIAFYTADKDTQLTMLSNALGGAK